MSTGTQEFTSKLLWPWLAALFLVSLFLFTRSNTFPFWYHPDEPGKVEQVLTGEWNFNHPMLLLSTTKLAVKIAPGMATSEQSVVVAGRWVSALFASVAVVVLSGLAFLYRGMAGAVCVGILLGLHHQFFELAHYMKEDTALVAGIACSFLALALFYRNPSPLFAALLGLGCALAVSGKYVGLAMLGFALPVLGLAPRGTRFRCGLAFGLALLAALALINLPLLQELPKFQKSFDREMTYVVDGQKGMTRSVPHAQYWNVFRDNTTPALWLFLACYLTGFWRHRREKTLPEWMFTLFPIVFALLLSFSPKSNDRYFLPATALFTLLAGLGAVDVARWLQHSKSARAALTTCVVLAALFQLLDFVRYWRAFQVDDKRQAREWVEQNLPPEAVIAQDARVSLPVTGNKRSLSRQTPIAQKVLGKKYAADLGSLEELKAQGVTHVAVSQSDYGRFFLKGLRPQEGYADEYAAKQKFYQRLFTEAELLWKRERGTVIYLHPGIELYRLR